MYILSVSNFKMGLFGHLAALVGILISITLYVTVKPMFKFPEKPIVEDIWWGSQEPSKTDQNIKPFEIHVSTEVSIFFKYHFNFLYR